MMNDQRSTTEQVRDMLVLAEANGLYDAADWVRSHFVGRPDRADTDEFDCNQWVCVGRGPVHAEHRCPGTS